MNKIELKIFSIWSEKSGIFLTENLKSKWLSKELDSKKIGFF